MKETSSRSAKCPPKKGKDGKGNSARHLGDGSYERLFSELGGYTVGYETYTADADPAELFKGLPDDHCQCPHWGVVVKGKLTYRYTDGTEETITEGEAHYARLGHLPFLYAGTEVVEFSPTDELQQTVDVINKNMESTG